MLSIGIDPNTGFVYEATSRYGHALWPAPTISPAKIVEGTTSKLIGETAADSSALACRFREDSFDPIARLRRGRFYRGTGTQPVEWMVQPHPAHPIDPRGITSRMLETYAAFSVASEYLKGSHQPIFILGIGERVSIWTIVGLEVISTGEELITLKGRSGFGTLPELDEAKVPSRFRATVREKVNGLIDEANRSAPVSVIDRARDAASAILLAHFDLVGPDAKDLGELVKRLEATERLIAASASRIVARLHARAKPVEQAKRELPPIRDKDAELATLCVGALLCELGWAEWA